MRQRFVADGNRADWYDLIQLLPASYNQMRTVALNYEVLANIYYARRNHKLDEWHVLCAAIWSCPTHAACWAPSAARRWRRGMGHEHGVSCH